MQHPGFVRAVLIARIVGQNPKATRVVLIGEKLPAFHDGRISSH
jgi:hypothetical protein